MIVWHQNPTRTPLLPVVYHRRSHTFNHRSNAGTDALARLRTSHPAASCCWCLSDVPPPRAAVVCCACRRLLVVRLRLLTTTLSTSCATSATCWETSSQRRTCRCALASAAGCRVACLCVCAREGGGLVDVLQAQHAGRPHRS